MTDATMDFAGAEETARRLLEQQIDHRVAVVREAARTLDADVEAERVHAETTAARGEAWKEALAAGWAEKDLRDMGLLAPGKKPPRAAASKSTRTTTKSNITPTEDQRTDDLTADDVGGSSGAE